MFIDVVVNKGEEGEWVAKATSPNSPRGLKFPQSWRGLRDEALEKKCGVRGAKFAHDSGHLVVGNSKTAVLAMIDIAYGSK